MFDASQVQELLYNPDEESIPYILFAAVLILNATAVVSVEAGSAVVSVAAGPAVVSAAQEDVFDFAFFDLVLLAVVLVGSDRDVVFSL